MADETRRLFFALWPSEAVRARLHQRMQALGIRGRAVSVSNLHLTLVFLGACADETRAAAIAAAARVTFAPFRLTLDRLGYFARARVLWLGPDRTPCPLQALVTALRGELAAAGVIEEGQDKQTKAFRAHVTLARKAAPPAELGLVEPVEWPVCAFELMESVPSPRGVSYRVLAGWDAA